jgi:mono/diheme cytochrome c family protein
MKRHLDELRASTRLPGTDTTRLPGDERARRRAAPMRARSLLLGVGGLVVAGCVAFAVLSHHAAFAKIAPPPKTAFAPELVAGGAELAAIGDCAVCHTAANGPHLAGGRGVPTPFGTVYATNITPDTETGIGAWSEDAFRRAMRDGIARDGSHLYPVLPYPHFTRATDADLGALYAYLMTRDPVRAVPPANKLPFPLDERALLAGWNLLFLRPGPWQPDPAHDAQWNRGAYLVEAVGHCGACHTPHNALGAEKSDHLAGGEAEGWYAPPLQAGSPARMPWTEAQLAAYLRTGFAAEHGAAAGPMTEVTEQLSSVPNADVAAIAIYIASLMPKDQRVATAAPGAQGSAAGQALFGGACGPCHADQAPMTREGAPSLALSTAVNAPTPQGVIQTILNGIPWREGKSTPYMPAFGTALTDAQVAELATYLRARYTDNPAWSGIADEVSKAREAAKGREGAT